MNPDIEKALETGDMGNLDPMTDAPNSKQEDGYMPPSNDFPTDPEDITPDVTPTKSPAQREITPEDVASRLEVNNEAGDEIDVTKPEVVEPQAIDLSQFTPETLQALKRMLNATPDRPNKKAGGISIKLRVIDGKILRDFSRAFNGYINDPEEPMRKIAVPKIKVWLFGETEPREMLYTEFMESERKLFKVVSTRQEVEEKEEGETIHNESGQLVTMIATYIHRFFTVMLPSGEKVEIKDKVANA